MSSDGGRQVTASPEEIAAAARFASDKAGEIESGVKEFASKVEEFCESGWQGQASDAFKPPFEEWKAAMLDCANAVQSTSERLMSSSQEYASRETDNKDLLHTSEQQVQQTADKISGIGGLG